MTASIIGKCGDRVVILEMPISDLPVPLEGTLQGIPEEDVCGAVRINAEGGVIVSAAWIEALEFGVRPTLDAWTEAIVTADGHSLEFVMRDGVATFQRTGPAAIVAFDNANRVGIANLSGHLPGSDDWIEVGWTYLLNLPAGQRLMGYVANGLGPLNLVQLGSAAVQFGSAWPELPKLRFIAWTVFALWAGGQDWPGLRERAALLRWGCRCRTATLTVGRSLGWKRGARAC